MVAAHPLAQELDRRENAGSGAPIAPSPSHGTEPLGKRELAIAAAIAATAMPPGPVLEGAGAATADAFARWLSGIPAEGRALLKGLLWAIELGTLPRRRRRFSSLSLEARAEALRAWEEHPSHHVRALLRAIMTPLKFVHYDRPSMFRHVGCRYELETVRDEKPKWMAQVTNGREVEEDLTIDCEVVVVGTGAGGAAAAYELASRGRAVLLLEEGDYHRRSSFVGRPSRAYQMLYRDQALMVALGNVAIPLWAGRAVGGSTVINSGTCYRTPERVFADWRSSSGLPSVFSAEGFDGYYKRVEAMLEVAPANPLHVGAIGGIIARGADHMGLRHHVLLRNAPACDGQGVCCFGCPTGAKRSTDVSYVPEALKRGAQLVTAAKVLRVDVVAGRARGVTAELAGPEGRAPGARRPRLTVNADAVVVAGGTLMTPLLLGKSGVCKTSGMLGKNLSIHPATKVLALFDDRVDQNIGIPQGYTIDHFADEGLMFEGGSMPFDVAALSIPWVGRRFTDVMERYPHMATFGFMVKDTSRGAVRPGPHGSPLVTYDLNPTDCAQMQRGIEILSEVFQAAGARCVLPLVAGQDELTSRADLDRLRSRKLRPGDFEVTAFHPLGTCRIGTDPAASCLGPDHEAHDVAGLYVCDGSAVPSSLGVNPQMTIMAMALRAAEIIDTRLS